MASRDIDCGRSAETAAYLDGELDGHALSLFEEHLQECRSCAEELREQRRLLCALDFALGADDPCVDLPCDFAQIIATNAESDMSGVRKRVENGRALRFCFGLTLAAFTLLGGATLFAAVSIPIKAFARSSVSILGFLGNAIYDAGVGAAVILRPLGRRLIFESHPIGLMAFLLFAFALALLPRLIVRYHRAQITE
jgi:predicted anti-sigma-YlaC factor YlaD